MKNNNNNNNNKLVNLVIFLKISLTGIKISKSYCGFIDDVLFTLTNQTNNGSDPAK